MIDRGRGQTLHGSTDFSSEGPETRIGKGVRLILAYNGVKRWFVSSMIMFLSLWRND
jgi:hypothetical protein